MNTNIKPINKEFYTYIVSNSQSSYCFKTSQILRTKKQVFDYIWNDDSLNETQKKYYGCGGDVKRKSNIKDIFLDYLLQVLKTKNIYPEFSSPMTEVLNERVYKIKLDKVPDMKELQGVMLKYSFFTRFKTSTVLELYYENDIQQKYYIQYVDSTKNLIVYDKNTKNDIYDTLKY